MKRIITDTVKESKGEGRGGEGRGGEGRRGEGRERGGEGRGRLLGSNMAFSSRSYLFRTL